MQLLWVTARLLVTLWIEYKTLRLFPLAVEHSVVVVTVGSQLATNLISSQFLISVLLNLCSELVGA